MKNRWHAFIIGMALCAVTGQVLADAEAGARKAITCVACHGEDGNGVNNPIWPKLAGQHSDYTARQLELFRSGERENAVMNGMAAALTDEDIADLADFYSTQQITHESADPAAVETARKLYKAGDSDRDIAACSGCHGPSGLGIPGAGYPSLGGQYRDYLVATLKAFRSGTSWGSDKTANINMSMVAERLTDAEIEALASYISGLH